MSVAEEDGRVIAGAKGGSREELLQAFKAYDCDGTGSISHDEIRAVVSKLGTKVGDISTLIAAADTDADGKVDFVEFCNYLSPPVSDIDVKEAIAAAAKDGGRDAMLRAFRAFDAKGDGRISREEVRHVVARVGTKVGDVSTLIASADTDGDGFIDYAEFVKVFEAAVNEATTRESSSEGEYETDSEDGGEDEAKDDGVDDRVEAGGKAGAARPPVSVWLGQSHSRRAPPLRP